MTWYIDKEADETGNHGNPRSNQEGGCELPEEFMDTYLDSMGFVKVVIENNTVTSVIRNEEAYEAYLVEHPDVPNNPAEDEPSAEELLNILLGGVEDE